MFAYLQALLRPKTPYDDALTERRARILLAYLAIGFIILLITSVVIGIQLLTADTAESLALSDIAIMTLPLFLVVIFWLLRNGYYQIGASLLVVLQAGAVATAWNTALTPEIALALSIPIITSGLLLGWRSTIGVSIIMGSIAIGSATAAGASYGQSGTILLILFFISGLAIAFGNNMQTLANSFGQELSKLQQVMNTVLGASSSGAMTENRASLNTINIINDQLGFTFVRIYLVEDKEVIERVQTGLNPSQVNIDNDIQLGQRSGIYDAISTAKTVVITENADASTRQHLLQGTRAALAVPVFNDQNDIIAVLDIQSDNKSDFETVEIQSVELVGSQYGQTLQRLRLINTLQRDLSEQDSLITRQREQLLQYERAERQTTTNTWRDYLQQQGVEYLGYDLDDYNAVPIESSVLTKEIESAIQTGQITIEQEGNQQIVSVPIALRGQTLGAMTFKVPQGTQIIGARQQELIRNVVQRLSLALENKRLFEQSQSQAERESMANEVGNLLLTSTDINTVLQLAAENFNQALGAIQTQIRLKPDAQQIGEGEGTS